ncbi:MAG: hypothetical protein JWP57_4492 [Spirosoma sp.]|nr:hypothetical protein [Spirosoma sp.]
MSNLFRFIRPPTEPPDLSMPAAPVLPSRTGVAAPLAGVPEPDAADRLPWSTASGSRVVWVLGTHGGAGETTLARVLDDATEANHHWPSAPNEAPPPRVLLTCRTSMTGLLSAQHAVTEWASGTTPAIELLGLVMTADAPGKLPAPLRDFSSIVAGGAPRAWYLPWVPSWRIHAPEPGSASRRFAPFIRDVRALTPPDHPLPLTLTEGLLQ